MIIGLSGKIGCGKSVIAERIMLARPEFKRIGFGDLLKREVADKYDFPLSDCYSQEGKLRKVSVKIGNSTGMIFSRRETPFGTWHMEERTVRELMQWYGTDYRRAMEPCYWTRAMSKEIDKGGDFIIDDVRFPNEARLVLMTAPHRLVRINPYIGWIPGEYAAHESETALDDWNKWDIVLNPGYGELAAAADLVVSTLPKRL